MSEGPPHPDWDLTYESWPAPQQWQAVELPYQQVLNYRLPAVLAPLQIQVGSETTVTQNVICYRRPDGSIVERIDDPYWRSESENEGYVEVPCDTEDVGSYQPAGDYGRARIPIPTAEPPTIFTDETDGGIGVFHGEGGIFDTAVDIWRGYTEAVNTPVRVAAASIMPQYGTGPPAMTSPDYAAVTQTGIPRGMYIDSHGHLCHRRRRRRRLLTESDFNDLMRIATLPNKQNVAVALAKAIGRR